MVLNYLSTILRNFLLLFSSSQTASLPGRIDQINHLLRPGSPQNRPISPISILRDSRPVSPLVFNSNHTSPTPSPSPERDPYPLTPPIRYQDFSPVKSEDDTGIHSGSSESDHEVMGKGQWSGGIKRFHSRDQHLWKFIGFQLPQDWFWARTWPPFHFFGTPIWPPWPHVKTLYGMGESISCLLAT